MVSAGKYESMIIGNENSRSMKPYIIISILFMAVFSGCQDVLDKHDLNVLDERIWEDEDQSTLYLNNLYSTNMPAVSLGVNSQLCDESYSGEEQYTDFVYGLKTASDINSLTVFHKTKYELIRRINICLEGMEKSSMSDSLRGIISGQALFFRAYRYWELVNLYGGVPIVKEVQDPFTEDLNVARSKTSESVAAIVGDLDEAMKLLPVEWPLETDKGRITRGIAAAFKGRVLLTWASPMFNPNNSQDRWQKAYDANKQAIEVLSKMKTPRALHPDFKTLFTTDPRTNVESVFYRRFSLSAGIEYTHGWEASVRPPSGGGNGGLSPTWELVKAFPMANGKLTGEPGSGFDSVCFWKNRDPRFYATVVYNGADWSMNGRTGTTIWTFRNIKESNRVSATGFYNRKAADASIPRENISNTGTAWHELRYAEVLLNFAECANELGKTAEALQYLRAIRARAGIEAGSGTYGIPDNVSKNLLREIIMNERQVEFAFENKRYWDMRRRLMFRQDLGTYVKKLNGTYRHGFTLTALSGWNTEITLETSPYKGWLRIDTALYNKRIDLNDPVSFSKYFRTTYKVMDIYNGMQTAINYAALYDFFAVPSSMLEKSPAVLQTKGWINGVFDPLAE